MRNNAERRERVLHKYHFLKTLVFLTLWGRVRGQDGFGGGGHGHVWRVHRRGPPQGATAPRCLHQGDVAEARRRVRRGGQVTPVTAEVSECVRACRRAARQLDD
eukprot:5421384-Pyramimonas_sp.AAC.1